MPKKKIPIGAEGYISCSQLGNLYGCGYGTPLQVYDRYKGGPAPEFSDEQIRSMEFGTKFEDAVAQFFCYKKGLKVFRCGEQAWWKKDMPYFICHPDRIGNGTDSLGRRFAVEIKCVKPYSEGWGEEGTEEIPDNYYLQVQGYYACGVPCDVVYVACMRGNRVYIYEILPDEEVIADIIAKVRAAKESFDKEEVPEPSNYMEATTHYFRKLKAEAEGRPAGDEGRQLWAEMIANHKVLNDATAKEDELKAKMVALMGDAPSVITVGDDGKIKALAKVSESHRKVFDKEAFKADNSDLYAKYEKEQITKSVTFAWPRTKKEN